jgi:O-succinylbenzoic acid--CoA ligase
MSSANRYLSLVPTQLRRIAQHLQESPELITTLREFTAILVGGQQPAAALVESLRDSGVPLVLSYGLTETAGGCVYDGTPLEGTQVRLDSSGVVEISGVQLAEGLGPWFRTADLAELNDGKLEILGRIDRVINSGGIKIALDLVEQKTLEIPGVEDCCAVALADPDWGQRVGLVIIGAPQLDPSEWLKSELGVAAVPQRIVIGALIPRLDSGKIDYESARTLLLG